MNPIKFIVLTFSLVLSLMQAYASTGREMFSALNNNPNIQIVMVSKDVLRMAVLSGSVSDESLKGIDSVNVYISQNRSGAESMRKVSADETSANNMKLLLSTSEGGESVAMYGVPYDGDTARYSKMVMVSDDGDNITIIYMTGCLDLAAMQTMENM